MTYAERKAHGLILTTADRREAHQIAAEIREHGGSTERWTRADRTPAISAAVHNLLAPSASCHVTPAHQLQQFYIFGEDDLPRGGRVWRRPVRLSAPARALLESLKKRDLDYGSVDERVYRELRDAGLAKVIFGSTGNFVFATSAGRVA